MSKIYLFSKTPSTAEGVTHIPIIQINYLPIPSNIYDYDYIIITSKEAINALLNSGITPSKLRLTVISKESEKYALKHNFIVESTSTGYVKYFHTFLKTRYKNKKLLYIRAKKVASDLLFCFDNVIVYETKCSEISYEVAQSDTLIFTSPSTINCFLEKNSFHKNQKIVVIGTTTQQALPKNVNSFLASSPSIEACIQVAINL